MSDHLSRKELKQDKFRESIEHGAEAVYSHSQAAAILVAVAVAAVLIYGGWKFYNDRQTVLASAALDDAMKVYNAPIRQANVPIEAGELTFPDTQTRSQQAAPKFAAVADKFSSTNPGKLARYYEALTLLDLEKQNQALESLKKVVGGSDKELSAMVLIELADLLSQSKPAEATTLYEQIKKEYPSSAVSERAERGLDMLAPKS